MNKQQRAAIAGRIADVLREHGAVVTIEDEPQYRSLRLDADFPGIVKLGMDVDDLHKGGALASWYGAAQRLNPAVFPGVNECHGCKATSFAVSFDAMVSHLDAIGACIAAGRAFD